MSPDPKHLLDTCLEIEGLLALAVVRNGHCSAETYELLKAKVSNLKDEIFNLKPARQSEPIAEPEPEPEIAPSLPTVEIVEEKREVSVIEAPEVTTPAAEEESTVAEDLRPKTTNESLSALFSINDKFLYCRELFGSSRQEMNEALDVISNMSSVDEVEDYLFNDLCLDAQNDTVKAFLNSMSSRFTK